MSIPTRVKCFILVLAVLLASACTNNASTFIAAPQLADSDAVVYIYRPSSSANFMMSPKVMIDDIEKFSIGSGDYRYVYLQNGDHTVGLKPADQYVTDAALAIRVEAGNSYYLRVGTSLKFEAETMNTRKFWIDIINEETARNEIAGTRYAGPKLQQSPTIRPVETGSGEGFSVDKTQDPFAGKYE